MGENRISERGLLTGVPRSRYDGDGSGVGGGEGRMVSNVDVDMRMKY